MDCLQPSDVMQIPSMDLKAWGVVIRVGGNGRLLEIVHSL